MPSGVTGAGPAVLSRPHAGSSGLGRFPSPRRLWHEERWHLSIRPRLAPPAPKVPSSSCSRAPARGKTATLVGRFRHLRDSGVDHRRILAVTFTRKAADEMRGRIARDLDLGSGADLRVYTFHGLALRCLQRNPQFAGLPERVEVWNAQQQRQVFSSRRMYWNDEGDILDLIAGAKEQMLDAARFRIGLAKDDEAGHRAAEFFAVYEAALREAGAIDFADMVAAAPEGGRRTIRPTGARSRARSTTCSSTSIRTSIPASIA